jgi:RNA polymerase sigma-70 factor (ECF subfamily)
MNSTHETRPAFTDPESWVESHGDYLFNYAVGQLRDLNLAEDLVQETLMAALRSHDRFAGQSTERTWLTGILRHKILDHLRHKQRHPTVPLAPAGEAGKEGLSDDTMLWLHEVADECALPSRRLELAEFRAALEQAMGTLPPRIAQVFELYAVQEVSTDAICSQLSISPNNLWVMLHRARKQLRTTLAETWGGSLTETSFNA